VRTSVSVVSGSAPNTTLMRGKRRHGLVQASAAQKNERSSVASGRTGGKRLSKLFSNFLEQNNVERRGGRVSMAKRVAEAGIEENKTPLAI